MADNVNITSGTGTAIAADEVVDGTLGTVKAQYVKLMDGTLDGTSKAAVGANGLAADVKASVLPTGAATGTKQDTGNTSLASIDGKITTVNTGAVVISSGSVTANAGTNLNTSTLALETGGNLATVAGAVSSAKVQVQTNASTVPAGTTMQNGAGTGNPNGSSLNVQGYAAAILNVVSGTPMSGGTTINFEASVDDTTWVAIAGHTIGTNGSLATTTTADGDFRFATAGYKSLRARISAWSAGVTTVKGYVNPVASQPTAVALAAGANTIGAVTGNVASAATDSGNPVKVGGKYNSSNITLTDGQRGDAQLDVNGFLRATLATLIAGENLTSNRLNVEPIYSFTNMTSATTTTAKSGAGTLHAITVNTPVASATISIFDNTSGSGTAIGKITLGATLTSDQTSTYLYDISFSTGLTIVTSGATDITISWR